MGVVKLDGKPIGDTGFVLMPGQRFWLERYPNDPKKLLFSTYEVDGSKTTEIAIAKNGLVEIDFYKEQVLNTISWKYPNNIWYSNSGSGTFKENYFNSGTLPDNWTMTTSDGTASDMMDITYSATACSDKSILTDAHTDYDGRGILRSASVKKAKTKETGRTEKGTYSNQKFTTVDYEFEISPRYTVSYKILPESQKQVHVGDIRTYCTSCGRRAKKGWKFCAGCGTKI